jgi:hypothetical protein
MAKEKLEMKFGGEASLMSFLPPSPLFLSVLPQTGVSEKQKW